MAVAYCCNCSYDPPMVMVGIVSSRYSYKMIKESGCFVVNLVGKEYKETARIRITMVNAIITCSRASINPVFILSTMANCSSNRAIFANQKIPVVALEVF